MLLLSSGFASLLQSFAPLFDSRVWSYAQVLLLGAILTPGKRTVTAVLRIVGRGNEQGFQNYHRVLNRARWSSRAASQILYEVAIKRVEMARRVKAAGIVRPESRQAALK